MIMAPRLRKLALTMHVAFSVASLGAVATFFALAAAGLTSSHPETVRGTYIAMDVTARFVVLPLVFTSLMSGLLQALGTSWGLFRHYWVVAKLVLTVFVAVVLLLQMEVIGYVAAAATEGRLSAGDLRGPRISLVLHAGVGLLVLLVPVTLSIYKPRGLTRYGWRKQKGATAQAV